MAALAKLNIGFFSMDRRTGDLILNDLADYRSRYSLVWFSDEKSLNAIAIPTLKSIKNDLRSIKSLGLDDTLNLCICDSNNPYIDSFLSGLGYSNGVAICMYVDNKVAGTFTGKTDPYTNIIGFVRDCTRSSSSPSMYDSPTSSSSIGAPSFVQSTPSPPPPSTTNTLGGGMMSNSQNQYSYLLRDPEQDFFSKTQGNYLNPENNGIEITPSNTPWR